MPADASSPAATNALDCGCYSAPWRVIVTGPRAEDLAKSSILAIGFEAFLPKVAVPLRQHTVLRPLFPGYLFARIDTTQPDWGEVYRARGVENVLRGPSASAPDAVPDDVIDAIRQRCDENQRLMADVRFELIEAGVQVQVTDGIFMDQTGVCLWSSHQRVRLMLDVLGLVVNVPRRAVMEAKH
jgi:transcription antitermination factor NusG